MTIISIQEARERLPELIRRLGPSDEVVITENDQPVARLVSPAPRTERKPRRFGTLKGTVLSMDRFDDPLEEFEEYM